MRRTAWAPAHISVFFSPATGNSVEASGSLGAGFCLGKGVVGEVDVEFRGGRKVFRLNGVEAELPVTAAAVSLLEAKAEKQVFGLFDIRTEYPVSQGFGISAAGTLAISIAMADVLSLSEADAWLAAHSAEVSARTGLGDVAAELAGGAVLRRRAGIPGAGGMTQSFRIVNGDEPAGVIIARIGEKLPTEQVLSSPSVMDAVKTSGERAMRKTVAALDESSSISARTFAEISREFSGDAGLITPDVGAAFEILDEAGLDMYPFSMVMLGNAVFFLPPRVRILGALEEIRSALSALYPDAEYFMDSIGDMGAHITG